MKSQRGTYTGLIVAVLVLVGTFAAGVAVGYDQHPAIEKVSGLSNKETDKPSDVNFAPFWEAWSVINDRYVKDNGNIATSSAKAGAVTSNDEKVWGAIAGLAKSLGDPYTLFFNPEEAKIFESSIQGNFEGVGMEIAIKDQVLTVIAPLKASPAEKAGIKPGDKILKIDGQSTADMSVEAAVKLIRGTKGTTVRVLIQRDNEDNKEYALVRDVITIPTIDVQEKSSKVAAGGKTVPAKDSDLKDGVYVVHIFSFGAQAGEEFQKAIERLQKSGSQKMIIDLRGNPGGYLEAAVDIGSWFIPAGKPIVVEKAENKPDVIYQSRGYELPDNIKNVKLAILIDRGSASASEILTGALSEYGKAVTVGERSFGKGSVQELVHLANGGALKVTIARWFTPKGKSISQNGITPDVVLPLTKENTKDGADPQMAKAIELLNK